MLKQREESLTKDEELALGTKIQEMNKITDRQKAGYDVITNDEKKVIVEGQRALEELVSNYYNLARSIAHKFHKRTGTKYAIEDLLQDAISALVAYAYAYDPTQECKLSTYAYYGITKKVSSTINFQRTVRMPENKMGEYITIVNAQRDYDELTHEEQQKHNSELDYVYENVGDLKPKEVDLILNNMQPTVSLNADIYDGNGELLDLIKDKDAEYGDIDESVDGDLSVLLKDEDADREVIEYGNVNEDLMDILELLDPYEKNLIAYEFGLFKASLAYSDFREKYNITDKKVKFETRKLLRKMRKIAEDSKPKITISKCDGVVTQVDEDEITIKCYDNEKIYNHIIQNKKQLNEDIYTRSIPTVNKNDKVEKGQIIGEAPKK